MSQETKNSCAKAFGNRSRNNNLKPKNRRGQIDCLLGLIDVQVSPVLAFHMFSYKEKYTRKDLAFRLHLCAGFVKD